MEDVMEACYLDSVRMCPNGFQCRNCKTEKEHKEKK